MRGDAPDQLARMAALIDAAAGDSGVSPQEARRHLEGLIARALADPDPAIRARWATCPRAGEIPTPEEALLWLRTLAAHELGA